MTMPHREVNIAEFYPDKRDLSGRIDLLSNQMFYVYRDITCGHFWIYQSLSKREPRRCPKCNIVQREPVAGFKLESEASEYQRHLIWVRTDEINQLKVARLLNERISLLEATKPKQTVIKNGVKITHPFNGDFYTKWLSWWPHIGWPVPEPFGIVPWKNHVSNWNFGPKIETEKVYTWDAPAISQYQNITTWSTK